MKIFWTILALCASVATARANDSGIEGAGGRLRVLRGEHRSLRMVSERVRMTVYARQYDVRANFVFRNQGAATTVTMGFPESGYGDFSRANLRKTAFQSFKTRVDGQLVPARRQEVRQDEAFESFKTYWIKTVRFGAHQTRRVEVSYRAPLGNSVARGIEHFALYEFTGGNWRGKVDESRLDINFRVPGTHVVTASLGAQNLTLPRKGTTFSRVWRNWQAQADFYFAFTSTLPNWMADSGSPFGSEKVPQQTITVLGKATTQVEYAPPAVLRDGVTFIALTDLQRILASRAEREGKGLGEQEVKLSYDAKSRTSRLTVGPHSFAWQRGSRTMNESFKGTVRGGQKLDEPPFVAGLTGRDQLYVPLVTVASTLGATVEIDVTRHRFTMQVPNFLEPG